MSTTAPNDFAADTPWVRAYERLWPTDAVADDDPRRPAIAQEMRELRSAGDLAAGLRVIGWWYNHGGLDQAARDAEVLRAMRRLARSKRLATALLSEACHA